ncbi:SusC/RagA family TonB-linked outer membrane protein [Siphonobacter sp. BAB-5385]|nr:SusC/RagA family TonB-linked outer membrane protein [Siphonobacter sp. BAB-5385]PMD98599.1 SusC/RagA family TonB-linked outer membrane protein [Siphonobacter sp. BAB-5405]
MYHHLPPEKSQIFAQIYSDLTGRKRGLLYQFFSNQYNHKSMKNNRKPNKILLRIMRLSICQFLLVILGTTLAAAFDGNGQELLNKRITLNISNEEVSTALRQIGRQAAVQFMYSPQVIQATRKVSLQAQNERLSHILETLFGNASQIRYKVKGSTIILHMAQEEALAAEGNSVLLAANSVQDLTITGTVTDETNTGMPGVNVAIKNTNRGITTDASGNYAINVPDREAVLVFSYIGYEKQEWPIVGRTKLNVQLKPNTSDLNEVVVVAYGQQKKATVTGAVASIGTKELVQSPVSNLTNALAGRLPGLITTQRSGEPGVDGSTLYIRGVNTLNNATPIVMVDGVERSMDYLDPNDIESLTILKDAAATAVLGMRGANGAVLVTTKRGSSGAPQVSFRSSIGVQEATRLPKYLGSYDYATLYNEALRNDGQQPAFTNQQLEGYRDGSLPNTDFYKFLMQPSRVAQANLNVSGGGSTARYFISAGYNLQEGNYRHTKENKDGYNGNNVMKRYNLRANVDVDITSTLSARLDLAGILTDRTDGNNSAGDIMNLANRMPPIYPIFNPDGSMFGNGTFTQNIYGELSQKGYRHWYNNTVQGTFALTRKLDFITKNLSAKASFSYDNTNTPNSSFTRSYALFEPLRNAQGQITSYKQFGQNSSIDPNGSFGGGDAIRNTYFEATLNWNRQFTDHDLTGMLLWNRRLQEYRSQIPYAYQSLLFRGTYNYKQKYLLEVSASYQGSENFPRESRYGLFPSISGGWVISEEGFLKEHLRADDFFKIRASYGEVGNDRSSGDRYPSAAQRFLWFTSWGGGDPYYFGTNAAQANGWFQQAIGNPGVTWERGRQLNVGLESRFWGGRLGFTLDLFRQRRSNILISRSTLSDVFGQDIKAQNIGIVDNKGFEFELTHDNKIGRVHYFIKPNVTFARNKIVYQDEVARPYPWMRRTGRPVGTKFGLIAEGFFRDEEDVKSSPFQNFSAYGPGDLKYRKLTGDEYDRVQTSFDETAIGYARTPEIIFGSSIGVDFEGFDVSVLLQGAAHTDVMLNNEAVYEFFQSGKVKPFHLGRWTPETAETATYPRLHASTNGNNHRASTFWIRSADYLRIKNLELGYRLPKKWLSPIGLSYFRVYINGMNLYTWDKLKDYQVDPEIGDGNGAMYPIQKIWNLGIDLRF